jgi:hypothetical protein
VLYTFFCVKLIIYRTIQLLSLNLPYYTLFVPILSTLFYLVVFTVISTYSSNLLINAQVFAFFRKGGSVNEPHTILAVKTHATLADGFPESSKHS